MSRISMTLTCLLCLLASGLPRCLDANEQAPSIAYDAVLAEMGDERFVRYCASCHGRDARGGGPVARLLTMPPADLRRIAQRRGGEFPSGEIARKIDGRLEVSSHGSREMPVWGQVFAADVPEAELGESISRGHVAVLVEYLKSIQEGAGESAHPEQIRRTMGGIFDAMRVLLPLSLEAEGFEDPQNQSRVAEALEILDRHSSALSQHGASRDAAFAHLSRSLSINVRDLRLRYGAGHRREARYLVQTLTETCVACHSRLPATSAPRSEAFVRDIAASELPLEQRAKLAYATRQFEAALGLYEEMLSSQQLSATEIDMGSHLDDYLELVIRVQRDPERARAALKRFSQRDDLSSALAQEVRSWLAGLARIASKPRPEDRLAAARALVNASEKNVDERIRLVEHLEASGLLHRMLEGTLEHNQRAEAYYLLGVIEMRIGRAYWLSQAEAYLETAIRLAPGERVARDAYERLHTYVLAGFTDSGGEYAPPDLKEKLDLLRQIAETPPR